MGGNKSTVIPLPGALLGEINNTDKRGVLIFLYCGSSASEYLNLPLPGGKLLRYDLGFHWVDKEKRVGI